MFSVPVVAEHLQLRALPGQQAGQRDDEGRDRQPRRDRALEEPDRHRRAEADQQRRHRRPAGLHRQRGDDRRRKAADRAHRQVDLAQQQHQHDTHRDRPDRDALQRQVGQVDRGQEAIVGDREDDPDDRQRDQDAQRAGLALRQLAQHHARVQRGLAAGLGSGSGLIGHRRAHAIIPTAPVMAPTTAWWLDTSASNSPALRPSRRMTTRSATWNTSARLCETSSTPSPRSLRRSTSSSTCCVCATPSAAVGSSRITIFGSPSSAREIATDCRWPPLQRADLGAHVGQPHAQRAQQRRRLLLHRDLVHEAQPALPGLVAQEEVRDDVEVVAQREVLIDDRDAERGRIVRAPDVHRLARRSGTRPRRPAARPRWP